MLEPRRQYIYWNQLGHLLKLWKSYRIADSHSSKLMRLWLGYEFLHYLDPNGIFPQSSFNNIRKFMGYKTVTELLNDIARTRAFYLIGQDLQNVTSFFSPVWHEWQEEDGPLVKGIMQDSVVAKSVANCDDLKEIIIINNNNPTGGNCKQLTEVGLVERDNDRIYKRRVVRDYFVWCEKQTDGDHQALVDDLKRRLQKPRTQKGELMKEKILTDAETDEVWNILVETQLVPMFADREDFFRPQYMDHPDKRIWWMKAFFAKFAGKYLVSARKIWEHRKLDIARREADSQNLSEMQNRPLSPHEWQDPSGTRWYLTPQGERQPIPVTAPPRPSDSATFNYILQQWKDCETK